MLPPAKLDRLDSASAIELWTCPPGDRSAILARSTTESFPPALTGRRDRVIASPLKDRGHRCSAQQYRSRCLCEDRRLWRHLRRTAYPAKSVEEARQAFARWFPGIAPQGSEQRPVGATERRRGLSMGIAWSRLFRHFGLARRFRRVLQ